MKIIATDKFNRETVDDRLVCENIGEHYGPLIVHLLNEHIGPRGAPWFFKLVEDDYRLHVWEP